MGFLVPKRISLFSRGVGVATKKEKKKKMDKVCRQGFWRTFEVPQSYFKSMNIFA